MNTTFIPIPGIFPLLATMSRSSDLVVADIYRRFWLRLWLSHVLKYNKHILDRGKSGCFMLNDKWPWPLRFYRMWIQDVWTLYRCDVHIRYGIHLRVWDSRTQFTSHDTVVCGPHLYSLLCSSSDFMPSPHSMPLFTIRTHDEPWRLAVIQK